MKKKPKKQPTKSKKAERSTSNPPKEEKSKWQEFLHRHSKAQENKKN